MQVEELFKIIKECTWEDAIHKTSNFCKGSMTCDSIDPYNSKHYVSLVSCSNGTDYCTRVTDTCKASMKKKEIDLCNSIVPDTHRYGVP